MAAPHLTTHEQWCVVAVSRHICIECGEPITGDDLDWPHHCEDCDQPIHDACTVAEIADSHGRYICSTCWDEGDYDCW